jgi:proteasome assembly chaperone (PAC2) family protein
MLVISIVGVIIAFTLLGITGFIVEPISANAVFSLLAYSTTFTISIDPIKVFVFKKTGLISQ